MTPTPAQIEAWRDIVAQAMACIRGETPEDISFGEAEDDTFSKLRKVEAEMSAALTAAAEVDQKQKRVLAQMEIERHGNKGAAHGQYSALTAAAEVGGVAGCDCYLPRREDCEAKLVAATIERCAEKIDAMIAAINKGYMRPDISLAMQEMGKIRVESLQDAAAAIRALKDK